MSKYINKNVPRIFWDIICILLLVFLPSKLLEITGLYKSMHAFIQEIERNGGADMKGETE